MEECRATGEGRADGRFSGEARIEENYLPSLVPEAQLKYSRRGGIPPVLPAQVPTLFSPQHFASTQSQ